MKYLALATLCLSVLVMSSVEANDDCNVCKQPKPCTTCVGAEACVADANSLASMKKNACITLGGDLYIPTFYTNQESYASKDYDYNNTYFSGEFSLYIDAHATEDAKLRIKLDLEDAFDGPNNNDLLEEVYFTWSNILCSGFNASIGKKAVVFGQGRSIGYFDTLSYGDSALFQSWYTGGDDYPNSVGMPGHRDNIFLIEINYNWRDVLSLTSTLYQNNDGGVVGMDGNRSNDFLQSFAYDVKYTPLEALTLGASFKLEHWNEFDNYRGYKKNQEALSVYGSYKFSAIPLELFAEYLHGWNWNYIENNDVNTYSIGAIIDLTNKIALGLQAEYIDYDVNNDDYLSLYSTLYYKMTGDVQLGLEFLYQRYSSDALKSTGNKHRDAYAVGTVVSWSF